VINISVCSEKAELKGEAQRGSDSLHLCLSFALSLAAIQLLSCLFEYHSSIVAAKPKCIQQSNFQASFLR
jgi:hypothetical protein